MSSLPAGRTALPGSRLAPEPGYAARVAIALRDPNYMVLWTKLKDFVERMSDGGGEPHSLREEELRLASAALLVRATVIDGEAAPEEKQTLRAILEDRFSLSHGDASELIGEAVEHEHESVDLYGFTSVLARSLDQEGRTHIVEMLWEVVMADGVVHEFEANLVWRASELLGVSTRDRVRLRKVVEARQATGGAVG